MPKVFRESTVSLSSSLYIHTKHTNQISQTAMSTHGTIGNLCGREEPKPGVCVVKDNGACYPDPHLACTTGCL